MAPGVALFVAILRVVSSTDENLVLLQLGAHWSATKVVSYHRDREVNGTRMSYIGDENQTGDDVDNYVKPRLVHPAAAPPSKKKKVTTSESSYKEDRASKVASHAVSSSKHAASKHESHEEKSADADSEHSSNEEKQSLVGVKHLANGDTSPRMLVMGGCSGSSFVMLVAMKLLEAHGIPFVWFDDTEMMKPEKNQFYTKEDGMGVAMKKSNENALQRGGVLAFQVMTNMLTADSNSETHEESLIETDTDGADSVWAESVPYLKEMGTHVVYAKRENLLDHAVCKVRDCFSDTFGIPVDGNGERSDLCFNRRTDEKAKDYKAQMIPGKLVKMMQRTAEDIELEQQILRKSFKSFRTLAMEDLLAYQYDKSELKRSLLAWRSFMVSWGVTPDHAVIKKYLSENALSHKPPGPHSETIYNIDEVKEELEKDGLDHFLRE